MKMEILNFFIVLRLQGGTNSQTDDQYGDNRSSVENLNINQLTQKNNTLMQKEVRRRNWSYNINHMYWPDFFFLFFSARLMSPWLTIEMNY